MVQKDEEVVFAFVLLLLVGVFVLLLALLFLVRVDVFDRVGRRTRFYCCASHCVEHLNWISYITVSLCFGIPYQLNCSCQIKDWGTVGP